MNSQGFLGLFALAGVFFLFWYWKGWGGASKGPTRLDLRAPDSEPSVLPPESSSNANARSSVAGSGVSITSGGSTDGASSNFAGMRDVTPGAPPVRLPTVMFNYNGHSWDAFEVLGVKPGASLKDITGAYQTALQRTQPESHAFLEVAYKSILSRF